MMRSLSGSVLSNADVVPEDSLTGGFCKPQACLHKAEQLLLKLQQLKLRATLNVQARLASRKFVFQYLHSGCKISFHG